MRLQPGGRPREGLGSRTLDRVATAKRVLVVGGGPAGLEYARIAAARGHEIVLTEREEELGGHVRSFSKLPGRAPFYGVSLWLAKQAQKNGAEIRLATEVTPESLDDVLAAESPDHVVVATGARYSADGFQGQTAAPLPGHETGNCVAWDDVALGRAAASGQRARDRRPAGRRRALTAVKLAEEGATVRLVTRWPMFGMETIPEVYFIWIQSRLYEAGVEMTTDHFVEQIDGNRVTLFNVYAPDRKLEVDADWVVMATGRHSENALYHALRERGVSVEAIGDAVAPRGTYEAVYEGHRAARKL